MIWLVFIIILLVMFGPALCSLLGTLFSNILFVILLIISAPILGVIANHYDNKLNRLKAEIDMATQQGEDNRRLFMLNLNYQECEERREKVMSTTICIITVSAIIMFYIFIVI